MVSNKALKFLISLDEKTRKRVIADFEGLSCYPFWDRSLDIAMFASKAAAVDIVA